MSVFAIIQGGIKLWRPGEGVPENQNPSIQFFLHFFVVAKVDWIVSIVEKK